jgi:MFS transporter, FSR family, fosmidomycin resistance protein
MAKNSDSGSTTSGSGFQTAGVVSVSVAHFVHDVYTSFLPPLLPLIIQKLGLSMARAGLLYTVLQLPSMLNPFLGVLADRLSIRYFVIFAPLVTAVVMSLIGLAPSYGVLIVLLLTAGISTSLFHVPAPVMVKRLSGLRVGLGMSFFMTGGELSRTVAPLLAVGAISLWGLEGFYKVVVPGVLATGWLLIKVRDVPAPLVAPVHRSLSGTWKHMRGLLRPLIGILCARAFMHGSLAAFLPTFLEQTSGSLWLGGVGLTILEAFGVAGILLAGPMSDRLGRRRVLFHALACAPVALLLFLFFQGPTRFIWLALTGLTVFSTTPVMLAMVQEHATGASPAAANGLFMMFSFLARSGVVVVVGWSADLFGLEAAYIFAAIAGLAAVPLIRFLPPTPEH